LDGFDVMGNSRIEDYALIGDCVSAALVHRNGAIDWLCWPRFDSGACFAALLGTDEHGRWALGPVGSRVRSTRKYRERTLILETEYWDDGGAVTVIDFMPIGGGADLVRLVQGRRGRLTLRMDLTLRFDYGSVVPWVTRLGADAIRAVAGPDMVVLRSTVPIRGENLATVSEFTVVAGETVAFVLSHAPSHYATPEPIDTEKALAETETFWRDWAARCTYEGKASEAVMRSLITLKALTYAPTGGLVAAPTTSLPELIGGARNWDYRFCWLRDATLTLLSLMDCGYLEEARAWRDWLLRAAAGSPSRIQIMYGLAGERRLPEFELQWLSGFANSQPVRVGNAAANQVQLDVYGELMDALHQARLGKIVASDAGWALQKSLVRHLESIWEQPDEGLWEVRGGRRHFTHSKVMAWVAFDRVLRTAENFGLPGPLQRWRTVRDQIHAQVCERGFDSQKGSFVQSYGSKELDASLLMIPLVGFLPPTDPRVRGTLAAIEKELCVDGFVLRYDSERTADGLPPGEGAFLACSFWFADNLQMQGRTAEAHEWFDRLLSIRNDVGLLAEEYDPVAKRFLGNFPQAFSHLALIGSALNLARGAKPTDQRPASPEEPSEGARAHAERDDA
jgi:GH15 family glucan-1,4-alpha-glucosidase